MCVERVTTRGSYNHPLAKYLLVAPSLFVFSVHVLDFLSSYRMSILFKVRFLFPLQSATRALTGPPHLKTSVSSQGRLESMFFLCLQLLGRLRKGKGRSTLSQLQLLRVLEG